MALLLTVSILIFSTLCVIEGQILHSVGRMTAAVEYQSDLANHLEEYLVEERQKLEDLES